LVLATANPDKAAEVVAILSGWPAIELLARPDGVGDVDETGDTLLDNARLKAEAVSAFAGLPAVADDTGLEVDALGGDPGVRTARYAGEDATYADNVAKLLAELAALPDGGGLRRARFRTVALVSFPDGDEVWAEGVVDGVIAQESRGSAGFGYDPVFIPDGGEETFAEMGETKHEISHRGRAFRALGSRLAQRPVR
jgi:XTP/dITP diphosphohydrolase